MTTLPVFSRRGFAAAVLAATRFSSCLADVGVGAKPLPNAQVIIDGSKTTLEDKWTCWEGPRFSSALPIKWKIVQDPIDAGTVLQTNDPAVGVGKYGVAASPMLLADSNSSRRATTCVSTMLGFKK
ncbi:MAG: hypothetical protein DVB28_001095 [Verrucomicrobia bacterium]|nr:MAG: hypothetical protein DVB28_001095 [Verrucomicrobiota bacterium]